MKLETYLDAMVQIYADIIHLEGARLSYETEVWKHLFGKRKRQYRAFRDRILRMDVEKDIEIASLADCVEEGDAAIEMYEKELAEKDAENQRLREALEVYANHDNWDTEAVAHDMETGDFPDVNGNTPTVDIRIELGIPIVWNWSDEGYSLAEKELSDG